MATHQRKIKTIFILTTTILRLRSGCPEPRLGPVELLPTGIRVAPALTCALGSTSVFNAAWNLERHNEAVLPSNFGDQDRCSNVLHAFPLDDLG